MRVVTNTPDEIVLRHRPTLMGGAFLAFGSVATGITIGAMMQGSEDSWPGLIAGGICLALGAVLLGAKTQVRADRDSKTFQITTGLIGARRTVAHPLSEVAGVHLRKRMSSGKGGRYPVYKPVLRLAHGMDKGDHGFGVAIRNQSKVQATCDVLNDWLKAVN